MTNYLFYGVGAIIAAVAVGLAIGWKIGYFDRGGPDEDDL